MELARRIIYQENGHGDVVALTDTSGTIVAQYTYDAWGNILSSTGTLASVNPYLYAGYRWDSAVGMYYLNARYYAPSIMRFISRDPLGGLSPYVYADDNPVKEVDPNGTWALDAMWLVLDVASFAANPSWGGAAWIAGDLASFADPTGVASTAIHAAKIARSADRLAETYRAASKFYEATKGTGGDLSQIASRIAHSLPMNHRDLLGKGFTDVTHPRAAAVGRTSYQDQRSGLIVHHDVGTLGLPGFRGKNHYHIDNPFRTGKEDYNFDINGNLVPKQSSASHILP